MTTALPPRLLQAAASKPLPPPHDLIASARSLLDNNRREYAAARIADLKAPRPVPTPPGLVAALILDLVTSPEYAATRDIDASKYDDRSDEDRAVGESHEANLDLRYEAGES